MADLPLSDRVRDKRQRERRRQNGSSHGNSSSGEDNAFREAGGRETLRPLPSSVEAERGVLSCILRGGEEHIGEAITAIGDRAEIFHHPPHRILWELLLELYRSNVPRDAVTITQRIMDLDIVEDVGGIGYLNELIDYAATAAHFAYYLDLLRDKHTLRTLISTCTECVTEAYDNPEEVGPLLDSVEQQVLAVREAGERSKVRSMKEEVFDAIKKIEELSKQGGGLTGLATGLSKLDSMTGGLNGSEMFIIAARPSMGKTSLVMNIVEHVAIHERQPVAVFSLEMSTQSLVQRLLCSLARIDMKRLSGGMINKQDRQRLLQGAGQLADAPLFIDDTPSLPILELRAKARRLHKQHGIGLIAIDYLQLMRSTSRRAQDSRQQEIAEISAGLKALAKELNIPIIVLAQLNRNPEQRSGKSTGRPRLSDLRESGSIEQDADVVGLLVRTAYYAEDDDEKAEQAGMAELIIAKQRNGPTGTVPLTFIDAYMRFEDRAFVDGEEPPE